MIESPLLTRWLRENAIATRQKMLLEAVEIRFGPVPEDISAAVRVIDDETELYNLLHVLLGCGELMAFRAALPQ